MPLLLKFNHILSLSEARYASASLAEWAGFEIGKGNNALSAGKIQEMSSWLSGIKIILEIPHAMNEETFFAYADVLNYKGAELDESLFIKLKDSEYLKGKEIILRNPSANLMDQHEALAHISFEQREEFFPYAHRCLVQVSSPTSGKLLQLTAESFLACSLNCTGEKLVGLKDFSEWDDVLVGAGMIG